MKPAVAVVVVFIVGLIFYFSCGTRGGEMPAPSLRRVPVGQVDKSVERPAAAEADETVRRAIERLPVVEELVDDIAKVAHEADGQARFVPTSGCTSKAMLPALMAAPKERELKCIWDARDFNPRGVLVGMAARQHCHRALLPYIEAAADLRRSANSAAMKEFQLLVEQRSPVLTFISLERYLEIARERAPDIVSRATVDGEIVLSKIGFAPGVAFDFEANLFRWGGDGWFGSRLVDMQTARPAYEAMAFTGLELVRAVIEFGLTFGTLTADEAEQLRAAAHQQLDSMLG